MLHRSSAKLLVLAVNEQQQKSKIVGEVKLHLSFLKIKPQNETKKWFGTNENLGVGVRGVRQTKESN